MKDLKIKKEKPELSKLDNWLEENNACSEAINWVRNKKSDLQKIKSGVKKTGKYNMEGSVYALEQFILDNEKIQWANWYIVKVLEEDECKDYVEFALNQMPKNYNKGNVKITDYITEAESSAKQAIDENEPLMIKNVIACVVNANQENDPAMDTNELLKKIIKYGIDLLKKRKQK